MNNEVKRTSMAIGAHADDIEINVGATLLKYHDLGYEIIYIMSTNNMSGITSELHEDGSITRTRETPIPMMERRKRECADAAKRAVAKTRKYSIGCVSHLAVLAQ